MARFLADLEGKKEAEYKIHTLAGTIIPVVRSSALATYVPATMFAELGATSVSPVCLRGVKCTSMIRRAQGTFPLEF